MFFQVLLLVPSPSVSKNGVSLHWEPYVKLGDRQGEYTTMNGFAGIRGAL